MRVSAVFKVISLPRRWQVSTDFPPSLHLKPHKRPGISPKMWPVEKGAIFLRFLSLNVGNKDFSHSIISISFSLKCTVAYNRNGSVHFLHSSFVWKFLDLFYMYFHLLIHKILLATEYFKASPIYYYQPGPLLLPLSMGQREFFINEPLLGFCCIPLF